MTARFSDPFCQTCRTNLYKVKVIKMTRLTFVGYRFDGGISCSFLYLNLFRSIDKIKQKKKERKEN